eukprot:114122-Chlamydomonas_euryale.AAC.1
MASVHPGRRRPGGEGTVGRHQHEAQARWGGPGGEGPVGRARWGGPGGEGTVGRHQHERQQEVAAQKAAHFYPDAL